MKSCNDLIQDFNLKVNHCEFCHDELDAGYVDHQPIIINGAKYGTPCCTVMDELKKSNIPYDYI